MNDRTAITIALPSRRQLLVGLAALAIIVALAMTLWQFRDRIDIGGILARGAGDQIDRSTYQAVFLTGSQVYFGRLATHGDDYFLLTDVYYLSPTADNQVPGPDRPGQLVKRGRELHGPQDEMIVSARNVLFIENLRPDGDVMTAIRRFKAGDLPPATSAPVAPSTPTPARPSPTR